MHDARAGASHGVRHVVGVKSPAEQPRRGAGAADASPSALQQLARPRRVAPARATAAPRPPVPRRRSCGSGGGGTGSSVGRDARRAESSGATRGKRKRFTRDVRLLTKISVRTESAGPARHRRHPEERETRPSSQAEGIRKGFAVLKRMMQITEIDDPRLVKGLAHPLRIHILRVLENRVASPERDRRGDRRAARQRQLPRALPGARGADRAQEHQAPPRRGRALLPGGRARPRHRQGVVAGARCRQERPDQRHAGPGRPRHRGGRLARRVRTQ